MYVLLIALVSNLADGEKYVKGANTKFVASDNHFVTYQIDYPSKERCLQALNLMKKPNSYMQPVYLKCLPK